MLSWDYFLVDETTAALVAVHLLVGPGYHPISRTHTIVIRPSRATATTLNQSMTDICQRLTWASDEGVVGHLLRVEEDVSRQAVTRGLLPLIDAL